MWLLRFLWLDNTELYSADYRTGITLDRVAEGEVRSEKRQKRILHQRDDGLACGGERGTPKRELLGSAEASVDHPTVPKQSKWQDCGIISGGNGRSGRHHTIAGRYISDRMMDTFVNLAFDALTIALLILVGVHAYRSMSDKYSQIADEQQTMLLRRIGNIIAILMWLVVYVKNVTETPTAEASKTVLMIGFVGLAIFIVFAWDRISAGQIDEKKDDKVHK